MFKKIIITLAFTVGLVGCGGGSSTTEADTTGGGSTGGGSTGGGSTGGGSTGGGSTGGGSTGGGMTGNCVTFPRPVVGQVQKLESKSLGASSSVVVVTSTVTAFSNTSISHDKVTTGDFSATGNSVQTFSIANNYMDITKIVSDDVTTTTLPSVGDITSTTSTTIDFVPMLRIPADKVCENQTWTSTYDLKTKVSVVTSLSATPSTTSNTSSHSVIFTVEAVNESKTVKAGTFNTFRLKRENGTDVDTSWIDIATGKTVFQESRDNSNTLVSTAELLP